MNAPLSPRQMNGIYEATKQDADPAETAEWRDVFLAMAAAHGPERARWMLDAPRG